MTMQTIDGIAVYPPPWKFDIDTPKAVVTDPPDDDFDQGAGGLDAKWTVVDGNPGVCSLTFGGGDRYDLTTREGWLLMQVDNGNHVKIRMDWELPDGSSVVLALAPNLMADAQSGILNNEINIGIWLNDNDADYNAGNFATIYLDSNNEGWRVLGQSNVVTFSTPSSANPLCSSPISEKIYFRICRSGLNYYTMWSSDGLAWFPFAVLARPNAMTNLWICGLSVAAFGNPTPIQVIQWLRLGGNGIDPW